MSGPYPPQHPNPNPGMYPDLGEGPQASPQGKNRESWDEDTRPISISYLTSLLSPSTLMAAVNWRSKNLKNVVMDVVVAYTILGFLYKIPVVGHTIRLIRFFPSLTIVGGSLCDFAIAIAIAMLIIKGLSSSVSKHLQELRQKEIEGDIIVADSDKPFPEAASLAPYPGISGSSYPKVSDMEAFVRNLSYLIVGSALSEALGIRGVVSVAITNTLALVLPSRLIICLRLFSMIATAYAIGKIIERVSGKDNKMVEAKAIYQEARDGMSLLQAGDTAGVSNLVGNCLKAVKSLQPRSSARTGFYVLKDVIAPALVDTSVVSNTLGVARAAGAFILSRPKGKG